MKRVSTRGKSNTSFYFSFTNKPRFFFLLFKLFIKISDLLNPASPESSDGPGSGPDGGPDGGPGPHDFDKKMSEQIKKEGKRRKKGCKERGT